MESENNACALITGASFGIGRAIAKELASIVLRVI
jgi:short-subunit dehydrogenase